MSKPQKPQNERRSLTIDQANHLERESFQRRSEYLLEEKESENHNQMLERNSKGFASIFPSAEEGKPMMLLDIDSRGVLTINPDALRVISRISADVAPLCIIGPHRTGKSYLLNRFANSQKGFEIGPTTNSCTKGVWLWPVSQRLPSGNVLLLFDTEGLNAIGKEESIDSKLFIVSALLCSFLIFNNIGLIDERSLEKIAFVSKLAHRLGEHLDDIVRYFPTFAWVVRDFSLELKNENNAAISEDDYLEEALLYRNKGSKESVSKNNIRFALKEFFKERKCVTLVRPLSDEEQLRFIDKVPYESLRGAFRQQLEQFISSTKTSIKPKLLKGCPLSGKSYAEFLVRLVDTLNCDGIPMVSNVVEQIMNESLRDVIKKGLQNYETIVVEKIVPKLPMDDFELIKVLTKVKNDSLIILNGYRYDKEKLVLGNEVLLRKIAEREDYYVNKNMQASKNLCEKLVKECVKEIRSSNFPNVQNAIKFIKTKKQELIKECVGPFKAYVLGDLFIDEVLDSMAYFFKEQENEAEKKLQESERKIYEFEGKLDAARNLLQKQREASEEIMYTANGGYKKHLGSFEEKIQLMKESYEKQIEMVNEQKKQLIKDNNILKDKVHEFEQQKGQMLVNSGAPQTLEKIFKKVKEIDEKVSQNGSLNASGIQLQLEQGQLDESLNRVISGINKDKLDSSGVGRDKDVLQIKIEYNNQMEKIRSSYMSEIVELKKRNKYLEQTKESNVAALIEKECEIKMLKQYIQNFEKEKHSQIDHASLMIKVLIFVSQKIYYLSLFTSLAVRSNDKINEKTG